MPNSGDLDTTFGTGGKVTTDFNGSDDFSNSIVLQSDGKIILGGRTNNGTNEDFALARYNSDGSLDTTFGTGGKVTTDFNVNDDFSNSIALQSDGKIILVGFTVNNNIDYTINFALARYNSDGSLDTTFGTGGKVTTDFNSLLNLNFCYNIKLQSDGKIILGGYTFDSSINFALARYNLDGSLDTTFGTGGKVTTDFNSSEDISSSIALQSDGKIILGGYTYTLNNDNDVDFALVRYNSDGSLDTTFGTGGKVTTDFNGNDNFSNSIALQSDGKIILGGISSNSTNDDFALARYNSDGSLDTTFGTGGKVTTDFNSSNDASFSIVLQSDGKIILGGISNNSTNDDFALAKYNSDGSLDTTFGTGGKVTTDFNSGNDASFSIILQSDGKIILGGMTNNGTNNNFALARYINNVFNILQSGGDPIIEPLIGPKYSLASHIKFVNLIADYTNKIFINAQIEMLNESDFPQEIFWDVGFTKTSTLNHMYKTSYYRKFHITFADESIEIDADSLEVNKLTKLNKLKFKIVKPKSGLKSISFNKTYPLFNSTKAIRVGLGNYLLTIMSDINTDDRHHLELLNVKNIDISNTSGAFISKDHIIRISNLSGKELNQFNCNPFTSNQFAL